MNKHCLLFLAFSLVGLLQACGTPTARIVDLAEQRGLKIDQIKTGAFDLLSIQNQTPVSRQAASASDGVLRVYLEGDGMPWQYRIFVLTDPTARNPLMLRLMSLDQGAAAYLGRPCYNGSFDDPGCTVAMWTSARYSNKVVQSMASGLRALMQRKQARSLWLIGHSGGGTLAMLLAEQIPQVTTVVTIAANLDVEAWTEFHGYTPLFSSLNPADEPQLRAEVAQWHLIGSQDSVIPAQLIKPFISSQPNATGISIPQFNHGCCWESLWPKVLRALETNTPALIPGVQFKSRVELQ